MAISMAIRLKNNMVMVFDAEGEQLPQYQGQYEDVRGSILGKATQDTVFVRFFSGAGGAETVAREAW